MVQDTSLLVPGVLFFRAVSRVRVGPAPSRTSPASRKVRGDGRCLAGTRTRRRHRAEVAEREEGNATSDLLLKYSDTTLATYI
jgi:hypothetical protein